MPFKRKRAETPTSEVLFDAGKVDVAALVDGTVDLFIAVDIEWTGSDAQIFSLQTKLHNYVAYALDGQMLREEPSYEGKPWRIVIACYSGPPDPRTADVLNRTVETIQQYGGDLAVEVRR